MNVDGYWKVVVLRRSTAEFNWVVVELLLLLLVTPVGSRRSICITRWHSPERLLGLLVRSSALFHFRLCGHLKRQIYAVVVALVHLARRVVLAHEVVQLEDADASLVLYLADLGLRQDLEHVDLSVARNHDLLTAQVVRVPHSRGSRH